MRVLIADDEVPARRKLTRFLVDHADIDIVGEAASGTDAIERIATTKPDVVFLDIHMPELDGIGVVEALARDGHPPLVVFVTAHDSYAIKAFEISALDYLLKPFDRARFERTLARVRSALERTRPVEQDFVAFVAAVRNEERFSRRLLVPSDGRSIFIATSDIVRFESDGNNVVVYARLGSYALRMTLESIENRLDPVQFARVHRSHIVNIDEISEIHPWFHGDYRVVLRDGTEIAWSRRYAAKRPDLFR